MTRLVLSVRRRAPRASLTFALGMAVLVISVTSSTSAYAGGATTASVLQTTKAAIAQQSSVHVVFTARSSSTSTPAKILADVGVMSGAETVSEGGANLAIRVTPTHGYIKGNPSGLTTLFGLSSAQAKKAGADWVSWKPGTSQYSNLKSDVTFPSVTALLPKAKGTKLSMHVSDGVELYILKWTLEATSSMPKVSNTLTILANGISLPVEVTSTTPDGAKATTTLSKWGELILVSAPPVTSTIASSKITG